MSILSAPCIFCHYNGPKYWQAGTHAKNCPFHNIGGADCRYKALRPAVQKRAILFDHYHGYVDRLEAKNNMGSEL